VLGPLSFAIASLLSSAKHVRSRLCIFVWRRMGLLAPVMGSHGTRESGCPRWNQMDDVLLNSRQRM
jgi:hypothetical protein